MDLPDMPLLSMLRQKMNWLNQRQNVLSQNVANADTPNYVARDLKPVDFSQMLKDAGPSQMTVTNARHIAISPSSTGAFEDYATPGDASPDGNAVSLEQEMIKVADTQAQFQAATNLYAKAIGMLRTAIGQP